MRKLFLIPARGGSKGLPRKNILPLAGRPMIYYTLDAAIEAKENGDEVCVSTDDKEIIQIVKEYGINVPFVRPSELASDTAGTDEVIQHAISWYKAEGMTFDVVVLLQVTSPLRLTEHIEEALSVWNPELDMVVSVKKTSANPYYVLFEEDENGLLIKSKEGQFIRRQECPIVYELNGAIYIIKINSFSVNEKHKHRKIKKYVMDARSSIDIDDIIDFRFVSFLLEQNDNKSF